MTRSVFPTVPPRVEYALTDSGRTLLDVVQALVGWAGANAEAVQDARTDFDRRLQQQPAAVTGTL